MYLSCHLSSDCEIQKPLVPMTFYICIVLLVSKMHSKTCPLILMGSRYSFLKSKEIISPEVMGACWLITQIRNVLIKECSTKIHIHSWNEFIHREYFWEWNGILSFWNYKFLSIRLGSTFLYPSRDAYKDSHKGPQDGYLSGEWKESGVWSHLRDDSSGAGKGAVSMCLGSHLCKQHSRGEGLRRGCCWRGWEWCGCERFSSNPPSAATVGGTKGRATGQRPFTSISLSWITLVTLGFEHES